MLLLLPVDVFDWDVNVIEQVTVEFDSVTTRHKHHYLFLQVLFEESKQHLELFFGLLNDNVALL